MKKTYMNPSMKVREMKHRSTLLSTSTTPSFGGEYGGVTILSRDADMDWDEEEDW